MAYRHGEFTWFENITTDAAASVAFYTSVFGWTVEEVPMPDGVYRVINNGDRGIGGIFTPPPVEGQPAPPPHWVHYLSVPDVDAAVATIHEHGGKTVMDAFDVPDVGRMALVSDPQGAMFHVWKGATEDPAKHDETNDMHWSELWSPAPDDSVAFYTKAFGLGCETSQMPEGPYHVLAPSPDAATGGVIQTPIPDAKVPPAWVAYVHVDDVDDIAAKVEAQGGKLMMPPMDVPEVGRFFVFTDPQGAVLGAIRPGKRD